ncbi:MAG: hypothetical protein AB8B77_05525 [Alphaproteobacteria bacterium]
MAATKTTLPLAPWLFIRMMQLLDDRLSVAPNKGKGSIAGAFMERHQDRWLMLSARLIDASTRSNMRFERLYFSEKIILMPANNDEWQLVERLLRQIHLDIKQALSQSDFEDGLAVDLGYELSIIEPILAQL